MELDSTLRGSGWSRQQVLARLGGAVLVIAVIAAGFWLAAGFLGAEQSRPRALSGDWSRDYESLDELLVIPGEFAIMGTVTSVTDTPPRSVVAVSEVLAGTNVAAGDEIAVRQFGIRSGPNAWEFPDARHLELGERVLLVLAYDELHREYRIAGGPHGHFTIDGSRVRHSNFGSREYGLSSDHPDGHPLAVLADGLALDEFKKRVAAAAAD